MGNRKNDVDPFLHDASRALVDMAERLAEVEQNFAEESEKQEAERQRLIAESQKRDKEARRALIIDLILVAIGVATLIATVMQIIE